MKGELGKRVADKVARNDSNLSKFNCSMAYDSGTTLQTAVLSRMQMQLDGRCQGR